MSTGEPKHRILVVEDEAMVSMLIEDMVLDCGCEVIGPVARFDRALEFAREGGSMLPFSTSTWAGRSAIPSPK